MSRTPSTRHSRAGSSLIRGQSGLAVHELSGVCAPGTARSGTAGEFGATQRQSSTGNEASGSSSRMYRRHQQSGHLRSHQVDALEPVPGGFVDARCDVSKYDLKQKALNQVRVPAGNHRSKRGDEGLAGVRLPHPHYCREKRSAQIAGRRGQHLREMRWVDRKGDRSDEQVSLVPK